MPARDQFIMERYLKGEIVHYDLPLRDAHVSYELSRELLITGVLGADFVSDVNQGMGLFPYNDCIHWVRDGKLKGGALLQPLEFDEFGNVLVTALGWSTMLDVPIINGFSGNGVEDVQNVLSALMIYTNDNVLGGQVGFFWSFHGQTGESIGSGGLPTLLDINIPPGGTYEGPFNPAPPPRPPTGSLGSLDMGSGSATGSTSGSLGGVFTGPPHSSNTGVNARGSDAGGYIIMPWEAANALDEIRTLCDAAPYDIEETEEWDGDTNNIKKTLKFHKPRMGTTRTDLRFIEGENIMEKFTVSTSAEDYANAVMVIGAGDDSGTVVAYKYLELTDAARRVHVIDDKTIYNIRIANAIANLELAQRSQAIHVGSIIVDIEHPNAPLEELKVGDDIRIDATLPFLGRQVVWHRITGLDYTPGETTAELTLSRSDAFNYLFQGPPNG